MSSSVFDIAGPVMVGPSSSHTAGAVKLGQFARALFDSTPQKATFILHGSFANVYKGHATDKALIAGVMKFKTKDVRIKSAFKIADEKKIKYIFKKEDLGIQYHPNTVKIILEKGKRKMEIIGSSVGGGLVEIKKIDEFDVNFSSRTGKFFTLILSLKDNVGMLASILQYLADRNINIGELQSLRNGTATACFVVLFLDNKLSLKDVLNMEKLPGVNFVRALNKIA